MHGRREGGGEREGRRDRGREERRRCRLEYHCAQCFFFFCRLLKCQRVPYSLYNKCLEVEKTAIAGDVSCENMFSVW